MLIYNFKFSNFWLQLKFYLDSRGCAPSYFSHLSFHYLLATLTFFLFIKYVEFTPHLEFAVP